MCEGDGFYGQRVEESLWVSGFLLSGKACNRLPGEGRGTPYWYTLLW